MTPETIGSAYQLDSSGQTFLTTTHMFGNVMVEQASITCFPDQKQGAKDLYWLQDLGHDLALVSKQKGWKGQFFNPSWIEPHYCYHWTLLPQSQWPWGREYTRQALRERLRRVRDNTGGVPTEAAGFYARYALEDFIGDVPAGVGSASLLEATLSLDFFKVADTVYQPMGIVPGGYRLVFVRSEVHSYLQIGEDLWTDCDGWKGASGGLVVGDGNVPMAITTGLGTEATFFFREKSSFGYLRHRLLPGRGF
jgi:hypothetical protein